ncbi:GH32 C-terminal domain-containing protein [Halorubrum trapanicum]|uniref:GH32 C-terminal domain-containing protein n=1 Tax=Halorubrum trapanicum TaxID=29284 RepID=UPI000BBA42F5|nr:GH32 C-terminal domain-containing protein [Halorubrum trapanicum]
MIGRETRVGFVCDGAPSDEQRAALSWLETRSVEAVRVSPAEVGDVTDECDVLWWHRDAPIEGGVLSEGTGDAFDAFLADGGGLLLTLRAMAVVDDIGVDPVAPDVVGTESVAEPTGVLWRTLYDDHPAVTAFDSIRIPTCDRGAVPTAHYESVVPSHGEVLASTVRGDRDVPNEMTVVSWDRGGGVIGVGAPVAFDEPAAEPIADARSELISGCLSAVDGGGDQPGRPKTADELTAMRAAFADDPTRPRYHFTPPANWLNDPNGLIRWDGRYHLFYQYNPAGPFHNAIHWGHAVSDDLLHWTDEPIALSPSPDGPDRDGCWSGCAVDDEGTPTILYTGGDGRWQLPCLATSGDPALREWDKDAGNPVIEEPPSDLDLLSTEDWEIEFRDHAVWRDGETWYQLIGSGISGRGGTALLYASSDLREWEYEGPLLTGDDGHGAVWECPELLELGERSLLHVSNYEDVVYFIGDLDDGEFDAAHRGVLDAGDFYAPQSLRDGDRYLTWGWLPETRETSAQWDAGWSGALSLPRVLSLGDDGRLRQRPAAEVDQLRRDRLSTAVPDVLDERRHALAASGRTLEIDLEVSLADASAFELSVFESADRDERTAIRYTREGELTVDRSESSREGVGGSDVQRMPVPPYDGPLSLRAFLDGSVIELFANDRHCLTSRVYPAEESTGLSVTAEDGRATVAEFDVWELESAITPVTGSPSAAPDAEPQ